MSEPGLEILPSRRGKVSEWQQPEYLNAHIESQTCHKSAHHCVFHHAHAHVQIGVISKHNEIVESSGDVFPSKTKIFG